jgi:hypothetical protein
MFRPSGQEVQQVNGRWQYRSPIDSGWLPGEWLRVTDPRFAQELDAELAAGEMTATLAEQYTRQGLQS